MTVNRPLTTQTLCQCQLHLNQSQTDCRLALAKKEVTLKMETDCEYCCFPSLKEQDRKFVATIAIIVIMALSPISVAGFLPGKLIVVYGVNVFITSSETVVFLDTCWICQC